MSNSRVIITFFVSKLFTFAMLSKLSSSPLVTDITSSRLTALGAGLLCHVALYNRIDTGHIFIYNYLWGNLGRVNEGRKYMVKLQCILILFIIP